VSVPASGIVVLTSLAENTQYVAGAQVGGVWRYIAFLTETTAGVMVEGNITALEGSLAALQAQVTADKTTLEAQTTSKIAALEAQTDALVKAASQPATAAAALAPANIARTGIPPASETDNVQVVEGSILLCPFQTDATKRGPWEVKEGAWVRPSWFAHDATVLSTTVYVLAGSQENAASLWGTGKCKVDTDSQTWVKNSAGGSSGSIPDAWRKPEPIPYTVHAETEAITNAVFAQRPEGPDIIEARPEARHPIYYGEAHHAEWTLVAWKAGEDPAFLSGPNGHAAWGTGPNYEVKVHAPAALAVGTGSDRHLCIIGLDGTEYDMWHATVKTGEKIIKYQYGGPYSPAGSGVEGVGGSSSATASGFALTAGIITARELWAHKIDHALFITIARAAKHNDLGYGFGTKAGPESSYIFPATGGNTAAEASTHLPPMGARCILDYSIDEIMALKNTHHSNELLAPWKKTVLVALATYGAFVGDTGGGNGKDGGGVGFFFEDGVSYEQRGQPNPIVAYASLFGPTNPTPKAEVKNEIELQSGSLGQTGNYRFHMDESTLNTVVDWKNRLKWVAPPPATIGLTGLRSAPLVRPFFSASSPINVPLRQPWEGAEPVILPAQYALYL
jgi:hypothetical protein